MKLDFWFEFGSPYSYPAAMGIQGLSTAAGAPIEVSWRAFLLGPIFRAQGWDDSPFNLYPVKGRYMWRDLERICRDRGIPFRRPTTFPRNGLLAARVACRYAEAPWLPGFVQSVYRANFAEDQDISSPEVVARCIELQGQDAEAILKQSQLDATKALLRDQTDEAVRIGIFGAPSFVVDGELFWGNDRLEEALRWASARPSR